MLAAEWQRVSRADRYSREGTAQADLEALPPSLASWDTCSASQPAAGLRCMALLSNKAAREEGAGEAGRKAARRWGRGLRQERAQRCRVRGMGRSCSRGGGGYVTLQTEIQTKVWVCKGTEK